MEAEPIIVNIHIERDLNDGTEIRTLTVDHWPSLIEVDADFLDLPFLEGVEHHEDRLTLTVDNGRAVYALEPTMTGLRYRGRLVSSRLSGPADRCVEGG